MAASPTPTPPGVPSDNTTLVSVLAALSTDGFDSDFFVTQEARLRCGTCRADLQPTEVGMHGLRRLEGASDPADMAVVLCLECPRCGAKGTAVARYGPEAAPYEHEVLAAVDDQRS